MERIPKRVDSKFRFVLLAAHRAEQMMRGAQPKVEVGAGKKTRVGMEEIMEEAVSWDYGPEAEVAEEKDEEPTETTEDVDGGT
ncbi:MAG: DNA-directed RNA polymerase subunit omega [bacterium]|nr:DNA-directed RNA polymerase subunit omega [bacterium]